MPERMRPDPSADLLKFNEFDSITLQAIEQSHIPKSEKDMLQDQRMFLLQCLSKLHELIRAGTIADQEFQDLISECADAYIELRQNVSRRESPQPSAIETSALSRLASRFPDIPRLFKDSVVSAPKAEPKLPVRKFDPTPEMQEELAVLLRKHEEWDNIVRSMNELLKAKKIATNSNGVENWFRREYRKKHGDDAPLIDCLTDFLGLTNEEKITYEKARAEEQNTRKARRGRSPRRTS